MKSASCCVLFLAMGVMGCVPGLSPEDFRLRPPEQSGRSSPLPAPVTANQVNPQNAQAVSQALWDEMDRQEQNDYLTAPGSTSVQKK